MSSASLPGSIIYVLLDYPIDSERFVEREVHALRQLGVEVRILTLREKNAATTPARPPGVHVLRRPAWWHRHLWLAAFRLSMQRPAAALRLVRAAWAAGRRAGSWGGLGAVRWVLLALYFGSQLRGYRPALIHSHFASTSATLGLLLASWLELPWGFSCHASDIYAETVHLALKARRADHIIACSEVLADDVGSRLPSQLHSRIHTVHHGLDLEIWRGGEDRRGSEALPLILAAGRFEPKKGFDTLIEACALLRDESFRFRCELIGAGREASQLAQRIAAHGLQPLLRLVPWRSPAELRETYAHAALLAVPSVVAAGGDRDNIPNVLVEALACGLPVVASALPAIERLLSTAHAGRLVPPGDPPALAKAIRDVVSDNELTRRLRDNGRRLVEERFEQVANAKRLVAIFAQSASRTSSGT